MSSNESMFPCFWSGTVPLSHGSIFVYSSGPVITWGLLFLLGGGGSSLGLGLLGDFDLGQVIALLGQQGNGLVDSDLGTIGELYYGKSRLDLSAVRLTMFRVFFLFGPSRNSK